MFPTACGVIAQLGERYNGIVEVRGSIPRDSTNLRSYELRLAGHPLGWATTGIVRDRLSAIALAKAS